MGESVETESFSITLAARWGDQDVNRHINNVAYFRYLEEARVQWMERYGVLSAGQSIAPVAVTAGATFLRSIQYPALLKVTVDVGAVGARSITLQHRIVDAGEPALCYAEGYAKLVWVDASIGKAVAVPEALLEQLNQKA